jgi:hypothetical protein
MNAMRRTYLANSVRTYPGTQVHETGKPLLRFVTPADVRDLKNRLDPYVRALDSSVATCKGMPQGVADGWTAFSKAWRSFFEEDESWWHAAAQMDQGEAYESDIQRWQQMIAGYKCTPDAPPPTTTADGSTGGAERWAGTIKTVAIAGAVVAVALGLRAVMR